MMDLRFIHPFSLLLGGSSQSGKTVWLFKLISERHAQIKNCPKNIFFFYAMWQEEYERFKFIKYIKGIPTLKLFNKLTLARKDKGGSLVIIDDGMLHLTKEIASLFTINSHHTKASLILVTHNIFLSNIHYRSIALNTHYIVLMRSARTMAQIRTLLSQIILGKKEGLMTLLAQVYNQLFSYITLDCHPRANNVKIRSNIFSDETPMLAIIDKNIME